MSREENCDRKGYSAKRYSNIVNLILNSFFSLEQISRAYHIPMDELESYASELQHESA